MRTALRTRVGRVVVIAVVLLGLGAVSAPSAPAAITKVRTAVVVRCVSTCILGPQTYAGPAVGPDFAGGEFRFTRHFTFTNFRPLDGFWHGPWSLTNGADSISGTYVTRLASQEGVIPGQTHATATITGGTGKYAGASGAGQFYLLGIPGLDAATSFSVGTVNLFSVVTP